MKKLRPDSAWAALTPEQCDKLEGWLFEENLSYADALERAKKEFGINASPSSLKRFGQRLAQERRSDTVQSAFDWLGGQQARTENDRILIEEAVFRMIGINAYEMWTAGPGKFPMKDLRRVAELLLQLRRQSTLDTRLALEAKKEERAANLQYGKATKELAEFVKANQPIPFPTKEEVQKFNELNQQVEMDKKPPGTA